MATSIGKEEFKFKLIIKLGLKLTLFHISAHLYFCLFSYVFADGFIISSIPIKDILKHIYLTHKWEQIGTTTSGQSRLVHNSYECVLHIS